MRLGSYFGTSIHLTSGVPHASILLPTLYDLYTVSRPEPTPYSRVSQLIKLLREFRHFQNYFSYPRDHLRLPRVYFPFIIQSVFTACQCVFFRFVVLPLEQSRPRISLFTENRIKEMIVLLIFCRLIEFIQKEKNTVHLLSILNYYYYYLKI